MRKVAHRHRPWDVSVGNSRVVWHATTSGSAACHLPLPGLKREPGRTHSILFSSGCSAIVFCRAGDVTRIGAFRQPEQARNRSARQPFRNDLGRLAAVCAHFPFVAGGELSSGLLLRLAIGPEQKSGPATTQPVRCLGLRGSGRQHHHHLVAPSPWLLERRSRHEVWGAVEVAARGRSAPGAASDSPRTR